MNMPLRVLLVEDSEDDASLLIHELKQADYNLTVKRVDTPAGMSKALVNQGWDIVVCDDHMPKFGVPEAFALLRKSGLDLPFILISAAVREDLAVAAMKDGAQDYVMKSNLTRLIPIIERELREVKIRRERAQAEQTIKYLAYYDPLTSLPNRTLLLERLQQAILDGRNMKHPVALLLMDLNHFKEINDTLGHSRGDILLYQVGSRIRRVLFEPDIVSRLGGDEFAVLLPKLAAAEHIQIAVQKILKALEEPFQVEKLPIAVEVSIGIALYPDHGEDAEMLFQRADVAMYEAKRTGNGYAVYAAELDQHSPRRLALIGELRQAIEQNQLFLHFQPKISLTSGQVVGVEALVRWQHPEYGFIPPDQFIGPAERTGLIGPMSQWVLNTALNQSRDWIETGLNIPVSVNLSARNLHDPHLPAKVASLLRSTRVSSERLELEITESAIMVDPGRALENLNRLSEMGIGISLDDFGTGYSSLGYLKKGYLKKLPVNEIKIDRSFVTDMVQNENDAVIVRSTIDLGHNLGCKVVAEGVERRETLERLKALICDAAQGYYISRPIPAADLTRWLNKGPFSTPQGQKVV